MTFKELTALVPFGYGIELSTGYHDLHAEVWKVRLRDWDGREVEGITTAYTLDTNAGAIIKMLDDKLTAQRAADGGATTR